MPLIAQKTAAYNNPEAEYKIALELFNKEKYGASQQKFLNVVKSTSLNETLLKTNAEYYSALCALELFNNDAEYRLYQFIEKYPDNSHIKMAYFNLGKFQYRKKNYKKALSSFEKVDTYDLSGEELFEYKFKVGYCYFNQEEYSKAKPYFYEIKERNHKYTDPATYYFSHIAYTEGNYETALKGFTKLAKNEMFKPLIPYYIVQIYYMQGNYDKLLEVAPGLLNTASAKRSPEIARMIGEAYFKTGKYPEAIPYLEMYRKSAGVGITPTDHYQLGYAYYRTTEYAKAVSEFKNATLDMDSLAQNAFYHMGDCYIKTNQKQLAYSSFQTAYKLGYDNTIREDALFNFAKLAYELAYNPLNEAINAFHEYIDTYPKSKRIDEASTYLVSLYLSTKNYKNALASLEKIKLKNAELREAYQKISYLRGVELFNDGDFESAIEMFNNAVTDIFDKNIAAQTYYWRGEAKYRLEKFDQALKDYNTFIISPGAIMQPYYNTSNYNIGYAYFKKKEYLLANTSFRKFIANKTSENPVIVNDAYIRIGDCYYVAKDFAAAVEFYDKSLVMKLRDMDYAYYQKAVSLGYQGKNDQKAMALVEMVNNHSQSAFADDALYELAETYLVLQDNEKALIYLNRIINSYPAGNTYVKKAMLKKGMIYNNTDKNELALHTLKKIAEEYRGTPESKEAIVKIREIYIELDKIDDFVKWIQSLGGSVAEIEQDSLTYLAVEKVYLEAGDCERSVSGFSNYVTKFPKGAFVINAYFYMADCKFRASKFNDALSDYIYVVNQARTNFTEKATLRAAYIQFKQNNYSEALRYYTKLEEIADFKENILIAREGKMHCNYLLKDYQATIESCKSVLKTEKVSNELINNAHMLIAKSALAMDSISLAQTEFQLLTKLPSGELGAEAKYNLAEIQFKLGNLSQAENLCSELANQVPSYDYWIAKSFILLSDIYLKTGNVHQAKAILQSIIDNFDGQELIKIANEKINAIYAAEKAESMRKAEELKKQKGDNLNFGTEDPKLKELFNENPK